MSKPNPIELLIRALIDNKHSVLFAPNGDGRIKMHINDGQSEFIGTSFEHLFGLFVAHYVDFAIQNSERIDGGCTNEWHTLPLNEISENCPNCNEKRYVTDFQKNCKSHWHTQSDKPRATNCPLCGLPEDATPSISNDWLERCPGCQQEITPENAGGYRTFCMDCVKLFPIFPKDGRGYTMEVKYIQADAVRKQTIFKWVAGGGVEPPEPWPRRCTDKWHNRHVGRNNCPKSDMSWRDNEDNPGT